MVIAFKADHYRGYVFRGSLPTGGAGRFVWPGKAASRKSNILYLMIFRLG